MYFNGSNGFGMLFPLYLNEATLFKLQVMDEKKRKHCFSHETGKKKIATSISSYLPHLPLTQIVFISACGGVSGALIPLSKIYFGLTSFAI